MDINKKLVRETLEKRFSAIEIKELAEQLNISYVEIEGGGVKKEIFELVEYTDKRGLLNRLWDCMLETRSDILLNLPKETIERSINKYLEELKSRENLVDLVGFASNFRMKIEFKQIFIPIQLTKPVHLSPTIGKLDEHFAKIESSNINELLTSEYNNLIVFGPLGSGKTGVLQYILRETANNSLMKGEKILPVYIDFSLHVNDQTKSLQVQKLVNETLAEEIGIRIDLVSFSALGWNLRILFDHLDELPDKLRRQAVVEVEKILSTNPNYSIIMCSSSGDLATQLFDTTKSFYVAKILPLSENQILELVGRLYNAIDKDIVTSYISLENIQDLMISPELIQWLNTPLEVTIGLLCVLSLHTFLPESITTIIKKKILTMQLFEWDMQKPYPANQIESNINTFNETLFFMAYHTYNLGELNVNLTIPVEAGAQYLVQLGVYQAPERARRELLETLGRINNATQMLYAPDLEFSTNYKFRNKTILDILAATYLFSIPVDVRNRIITSRLEEKSWRPLFTLLFDILVYQSMSDAEQYLDLIISDIRASGKITESDADKLLLVTNSISRGKLNQSGLLGKAKEMIVKILSDREQIVSLRNRISLAEYLGEFGDPRIGTESIIGEGLFWRGFDQFPNDRPARQISLPLFTIDTYPVTNQEYILFMDDNGYLHKEFWDPDGWKWIQETGRKSPRYWIDPRFNKPNYPVVGVSWFEADAYARWAGKRLPTEAEWEKAARGAIRSNGIYYYWPWGDSFNGAYLNCSDSTEFVHGTTPIGVYPSGQSPYGVFDMSGNTSEWVADWYDAYTGNNIRDLHYGNIFKVRRGGGWGWDSDFARCTCRNASPRTADYAVCGFRCCR